MYIVPITTLNQKKRTRLLYYRPNDKIRQLISQKMEALEFQGVTKRLKQKKVALCLRAQGNESRQQRKKQSRPRALLRMQGREIETRAFPNPPKHWARECAKRLHLPNMAALAKFGFILNRDTDAWKEHGYQGIRHPIITLIEEFSFSEKKRKWRDHQTALFS